MDDGSNARDESTATPGLVTTGMLWGIKASLLHYIGGLEDGSIEVVAPAERRGELFWFPATGDNGQEFGGAVRLQGHWGMLDIDLRDPRLELDGEHATLLVRERGRECHVPLASLVRSEGTADAVGRGRSWTATLTGLGAMLLGGGQYTAGAPLDPIVITESDRG